METTQKMNFKDLMLSKDNGGALSSSANHQQPQKDDKDSQLADLASRLKLRTEDRLGTKETTPVKALPTGNMALNTKKIITPAVV